MKIDSNSKYIKQKTNLSEFKEVNEMEEADILEEEQIMNQESQESSELAFSIDNDYFYQKL